MSLDSILRATRKNLLPNPYEPYEYLGPKTIKMSSNSKNLIPYPYATTSKTISGVTFTVQEDGGIKVEGTPNNPVSMFYISTPANTISALKIGNTYTLSGYRSGSGATLFYQNTEVSDSYTFTCDAQNPLIGIKVIQGTTADALFYPQLEEGSVATNYELNTGSKEVLKVRYNSRNLLPYPYFHSSMTNQAGIAYTVNSDGTVTANGTATGRSEFVLSANKTNWMSGNYTLSGCPAGGSKDTYSIITVNGFSDVGSGITIPQSELTRISIIIKQGTTVDNLVFKPQLELGNKKTDYVPYFNTVVWTYKQPVLTGYNITSTNNDDGTQSLNIVDATSTTDQYNITSTDNSDGTQTLNITDT